jgi:PUA-domain protein
MSTGIRRYPLRKNERKLLLKNVLDKIGLDIESLFGSKTQVEVMEAKKVKVYVVDGRPLIAESEGNVFPTLLFEEQLSSMPKVVVDMGAVPYICNKADIMGPGIVDIQGEFEPKNLVIVLDAKNRKPIAVSEAIYDSGTAASTRKGKLFRNLHCVGDEIWVTIKEAGKERKS